MDGNELQIFHLLTLALKIKNDALCNVENVLYAFF